MSRAWRCEHPSFAFRRWKYRGVWYVFPRLSLHPEQIVRMPPARRWFRNPQGCKMGAPGVAT
eukprot:2127161-Pyramimonas_sp.AAC.1